MSTQAIAPPVRAQMNRMLVAALVATTAMLFTAFAAAYLERAGARGWGRIALPRVLWLNTAVLLLSSVLAEVARRVRARPFDAVKARSNVLGMAPAQAGIARWALPLALLLGLLFLLGQAAAWGDLRARGFYLPTHPYASFFYLLTGVHAVHVVAALLALSLSFARTRILGLAVLFWHFMGFVWLYVLGILTVLG
jgi:cytochrome c oxidase subunit 3